MPAHQVVLPWRRALAPVAAGTGWRPGSSAEWETCSTADPLRTIAPPQDLPPTTTRATAMPLVEAEALRGHAEAGLDGGVTKPATLWSRDQEEPRRGVPSQRP